MTYETNLECLREIMADQSPSIQAEYTLDRLIAGVDELCAIALKAPEMLDRKAVGQLFIRAQLLASFLIAADTPKLKLVRNAV